MITLRQRRFITLALDTSFQSTYDRVKIGAVIARRSKLVSKAANLRTSHPLQKLYNDRSGRLAPAHNCHAEINAIIQARDVLDGCDAYVGRWDRRGNLAMCKPCVACQAALRDVGIKSVTYTTREGIVYESIS